MPSPKLTITLPLLADLAKQTDDGTQLSVFAIAENGYEYSECNADNYDYLATSIKEHFDSLDHEAALIDTLNKGGAKNLLPFVACFANKGKPCDLQSGACLALHFPDEFHVALATWTATAREQIFDILGDFQHLPEPYATDLQHAYDSLTEDLYHQYLYGDRSDVGILGHIEKTLLGNQYHDGARIMYDQKTDRFTLSTDDAHQLLCLAEDYDQGDYPSAFYDKSNHLKRAPSIKTVADKIVNNVYNRFQNQLAKRKADSAAHRAERERVLKYKKEQAEQKEAERVARLLKMKK